MKTEMLSGRSIRFGISAFNILCTLVLVIQPIDTSRTYIVTYLVAQSRAGILHIA